MSNNNYLLDEAMFRYCLATTLREPAILSALRDETSQIHGHQMQIAPEQGQFMALLVKLINAKRILEIGTYTGYSSLVMALALPDDGKLITLDKDIVTTAIAKKYWQEVGVAELIELIIGAAVETLEHLKGPFDLIFIDANKRNYPFYYEKSLSLLRSGGLMLIDNALQNGKVASPQTDKQSAAFIINELNHLIAQDQRVDCFLLAIADGLMLVRKR